MAKKKEAKKVADLHIRCTPEEHELFLKAAEKDDRSLSSWIRNRLSKAAKLDLAKD